MITILIVEDNLYKREKVENTIKDCADIPLENIRIATTVKEAKTLLYKKTFDLVILDLVLPVDSDDSPSPENGIKFLEEIQTSPQIKPPIHIIGLTGFTELRTEYSKIFTKYLWHLIEYKAEESNWQEQLKNIIYHLIKTRRDFLDPDNFKYDYDVGIITALQDPELTQILKIEAGWEEIKLKHDATVYFKGSFKKKDGELKVVAACLPQMGMTSCATFSMKMINNFKPKYLIMTGIAAGIKGSCNYGDILVADQSYDGASGKIDILKDGEAEFKPNYNPIPLDSDLRELIRKYISKDEFLFKIRKGWEGNELRNDLKLHIGPMASIPYVINHGDEIIKLKSYQRKLIGIEMEGYAIFYSATNGFNPKPKPLLIKSVCDFGDGEKNDNHQKYAAYISAKFMHEFVVNEL